MKPVLNKTILSLTWLLKCTHFWLGHLKNNQCHRFLKHGLCALSLAVEQKFNRRYTRTDLAKMPNSQTNKTLQNALNHLYLYEAWIATLLLWYISSSRLPAPLCARYIGIVSTQGTIELSYKTSYYLKDGVTCSRAIVAAGRSQILLLLFNQKTIDISSGNYAF